jgi:hypothetical protein
MKAAVGFLHAGEKSREVTVRALAERKLEAYATHLVDASLVDATATDFPIDSLRYAAIRARAALLAKRAERLVLTCSVYNGVASWLAQDLGLRVDRSDAAAARALLATRGPIGVLVSYAPTRPVVVDYLAEDAPPFATAPDAYGRALVAALEPLRDCGVLFVSQYTMHAHLEELRRVWGPRPIVSALRATVDALFPA